MNNYKTYANLAKALIESEAHTATKYISDKYVIRATRRLFKHRKWSARDNVEISFVAGRPNYAARQFIKDCKKAGEPFPVKKIQLKFPPKSR